MSDIFTRAICILVAVVLIGCQRNPIPTESPSARMQIPDEFPLRQLWCIQEAETVSKPLYTNGTVIAVSGVEIGPGRFGLDKHPFSYKAYDAQTGELRWQIDMEDRDGLVGTGPYWTALDKWVVLGSSSTVDVVDLATGRYGWHIDGGFGGLSVGDNKVFVVRNSDVEAYDIETGRRLWWASGPTQGKVPPWLDEENDVVAGNFTDGYFVYDANTGHLLARRPKLSLAQDSYGPNNTIIYNGMVLVGDQAFDMLTGNLVHDKQVWAHPFIRPFVAGDVLLINGYEGHDKIVAESLKSFSRLWERAFTDSQGEYLKILDGPVAIGNTVYVILSDASIRALDLKTGADIEKAQAHAVVDRGGVFTPFVAGLVVGRDSLFVSFGDNNLCALGKE